ncbi:MAG: alpha-amylase family glycosyl hydrolase [Alphaproteobacteria bacterium]|nr:alpha-amylase family glycosyl hydrolase [Alphaproteobacteria bacterium]
MKHFKIYLSLVFVAFLLNSKAQNNDITCYPPNWWSGLKLNKIQILLHSPNKPFAKNAQVSTTSKSIDIKKTIPFSNPNYLIIEMEVKNNAAKENAVFSIAENSSSRTFNWEILTMPEGNGVQYAQGINPKDFIYFLMPDRFSNGDEQNDINKRFKDQSLNRDSIFLRHGGDLEGVINHLDYLQELGVTTLWTTPVLENDMPNRTEHGYAITNHYRVDERFGGDNAYIKLSAALHKRGQKLIMDAVYNHVGRFHFLVQDPPANDWLHQWPTFTQTNYKEQPLFDPYAAQSDKKKMLDGWFTTEMPDLNHQNKFVENYLIQHAIWCVLKYGIDAWRIDTYIYNDLEFMNRLHTALVTEFPKITDFGECMVHGTVNQAFFCENNLQTKFKSNLHAVVDFQLLFYGINQAVNEDFGWTSGVNRLYNTLTNDFIYKDAFRNVILLDNHDLSRWYSVVGENLNKAKIGVQWLLTSRGIPQLYYGTEVIMKGFTNPDGWVRLDFPGGWKHDNKNVFTQTNLTTQEAEMLALVKKLGNYRKNTPALQTGKLKQFLPQDGLYVYFRYDDNKTIMCVMNTSKETKAVHFKDYEEITQNFKGGLNVVNNIKHTQNFDIPATTMYILELVK